MPPMSKVDLFTAIRRDSRAGLSVRALARTYQRAVCELPPVLGWVVG